MSAARRLLGRVGRGLAGRGGRCGGLEQLESRLHLAAVVWDGGAGTDSWHDAQNWDNNAVPTAADDVTIPDTALAEVKIFAADAFARTVTTDENMLVRAGRRLSVTDGMVLNATLTLGNGSENAALSFTVSAIQTFSGNGSVIFDWNGAFTSTGVVAHSGVHLTIASGITIRGGNAIVNTPDSTGSITNYGTISADVAGRRISLFSGSNGLHVNHGTLRATNGGTLSAEMNSTGVVVDNQGLIDIAGGTFVLENGSAFTNAGQIVMNSGTLQCNGTSTFTNSTTGAIDANGGTLNIRNGSNAGTIDVASGVIVNFLTSFTHNAGANYLGLGQLNFSTGTHTFNSGTFTFESRAVISGSGTILTGPGDLVFNGLVTWSAGTLSGAGTTVFGTASVVSRTGGTLSRVLENYGQFTTTVFPLPWVSLINRLGALLTYAGPSDFGTTFAGRSGDPWVLNNQGTFVRTGVSDFAMGGTGFAFVNEGVLNVEQGGLQFTNFTNTGTVNLNPGATLPGQLFATSNAGIINVNGGYLRLSENFGEIVITDGTLDAVSGFSNRVDAIVQVAGGAESVILLNGELTATFLNEGSVEKSGVGTLTIRRAYPNANKTFDNQGSLRLLAGNINFFGINGGEVTFINPAMGVVEIDSGVLSLRPGSNAGPIDVGASGTVDFQSTFSHLAGAMYTGPGTINFSGGTHTFAAGEFSFAAAVDISGGTLTGAGIVTFNGAVLWRNNATIGGAGSLAVGPTGVMTLQGGTLARPLVNHGLVNWTDGDLTVHTSGTATNAADGTFVVTHTTDGRLQAAAGASGQFINQGTFNKTGGAYLSVNAFPGDAMTFRNEGAVNVSAGIFNFSEHFPLSLLHNTPAGVVSMTSGGWMSSFLFNNEGTLNVGAGSIAQLYQLPMQFVDDTLVGGTWNIAGELQFQNGTPTVHTIGVGAAFTLIGPGASVGGALNGLTTNNGLLTIRDPGVFPFNPAGGEFFNNGVLALTGTGTFSIPQSITFNNGPAGAGGVVRVGDNLRGPGPIIIDDPIDGGTLDIFGTATIDQDFDIFAVINLHPGGTLNGTGHITAQAAFNWFGGLQSGTGSTTAAAQLTLHGTDVMTLSRELVNTFAGNWTGGCLLLSEGQFANAAGAGFAITGTVEVLSAGLGGEEFFNDGELIFEAGSDTSFGENAELTSGENSTAVYFSDATFEEDQTFEGNVAVEFGGVLSGPGNITFLRGVELRAGGELTGTGDFTFLGEALMEAGSQITGSGTALFMGTFTWSGGEMAGTGMTVIDVGAVFVLDGGDKMLSRVLDNFSVAGNWTGGCLFMLGGIFNNQASASLDVRADPVIEVVDAGGVNEFNNAGLITVHTGEFIIGVPGTNTGTIIVIPPDTLVFAAAWTHMPGSRLEGPGGVRFEAGQHTIPAGGLGITGPITITGGALVLAAMFMPNYNAATFTFTGGNWSVSGDGQLFLNGAEIRVIGADTTFALAGSGVIGALATLARIDGTLSLADGAVFTSNPGGVQGVFVNAGLITIGTGAVFAPALYQQSAAGVLETRLTGLGAQERGYVDITGNADLAGTLRIEHVEGFDVAMGQQITFFNSAATNGWFDEITVGAPGAGLHVVLGEFEGQVLFTITHAGDWNLDFVRDVQDIFDFLTDWFTDDGDYNGDGINEVPDIFAFLTAWFTV